MAPTAESVKAVHSWLSSNGIRANTLPGHGDWFAFTATVKEAETLFGADFKVFKHSDTGKQDIRTLSYSIPAELQGHLEVVHPMTTSAFQTLAAGLC
jgi:tripeptidyl-peptidase-1